MLSKHGGVAAIRSRISLWRGSRSIKITDAQPLLRPGGKMARLFIFTVILFLLVTVNGYASSPEAWAEHDRKL
jgi:hypothetical protein